ncbi:MAG: hypothetical protein IKS98_05655 [Lachnospiraceae bacterium]|nr:hypothetical protein [Lachnospiraceae bacterium]
MKKLLSKMAVLLSVLMLLVSSFATVAVSAAETDFLNQEPTNDIFGGTTKVAKDAGSSLKSLVVTVAIIVLVIGLIVVGLQFTSKNSAKRMEAKSNLVAVIIGAIIVFGAVAIIAFSGTIADSLSKSLNSNGGGSGGGSGTPTTTSAPESTGGAG